MLPMLFEGAEKIIDLKGENGVEMIRIQLTWHAETAVYREWL